MTTRKRRLSRRVEKYVLNPPMRLGLRMGLTPRNFAMIETTGRRTGKTRRTPVGNGISNNTFWLVAEHGRSSDYVQNMLAEPRVRVRANRTWRDGVATPVPSDDGLARRREIDARHGINGRIDGWIFAKTATDPLTIRIDLDVR